MKPRILAINPYICDFKCYDEWRRPLGLYHLCFELNKYGVDTTFIDILDRYDDELDQSDIKAKKYHTGYYHENKIDKPVIYKNVPKTYRSFGMPESLFLEKLRNVGKIDMVLITSKMTYWYPGVFRTIELIKKFSSKIPIILGGTYATLCFEHAKQYSKADMVLAGNVSTDMIKTILRLLGINQQVNIPGIDFYYPTYLKHFGNLVTSFGCPYLCTYCASHALQGNYRMLGPNNIFSQFKNQYKKGITHFAFYDDALLVNFEENLKPFLTKIINDNYNTTFHTPNGIHARLISPEVASILCKSNFKTIRFGYESHIKNIRQNSGDKVTDNNLKNAIKSLQDQCLKDLDVGVYLLWGLMNQNFTHIKDAIYWIRSLGAKPKILNLSPIPQTAQFAPLAKMYPILNMEPLSHNDSYFNLLRDPDHYAKLEQLKALIR